MSEKLDCTRTPLLGGSTTCVLAGAEVEGVTLHWMAESSASIHFRHRAQVTNSCSVVVSCAGYWTHDTATVIWTWVLYELFSSQIVTTLSYQTLPLFLTESPITWSSENNYEKEFGRTKRSMYYKLTNVRIGLLCIILLIIWSLLCYYYTCFHTINNGIWQFYIAL